MTEKLWIPLLSVAIGALLGGVINAMIGRYAAFKESKGIAAALRAEIHSVLLMVQLRGYVPGLTNTIDSLSHPTHVVTTGDVPRIFLTQDYFSAFHATISKIGLIGELAGPVTRLYVFGKGLVEDLAQLRMMHETSAPGTRQELSDYLKEVRSLFEAVETEGRQLIARLDEYVERRWFKVLP